MRFAALHFAARGWILAAAFGLLLWARLRGAAPLQPQYLPFLAAAIALRLWAGAHLGPHGNDARAGGATLATTGPYAFTRNPLYLSNLAAAAGLILYANALSKTAAALLLILLFAHHHLLALWEESRLRDRFGPDYADYARRVPRWFSFRPPEAAREEGRSSPRAVPSAMFLASLARQGRNAGYALACAVLLWIAARAGGFTTP